MTSSDMTYNLLKRVIQNGGYDKTDILGKMDIFLTFDRISQDQYTELQGLIGGNAA